MSATATLNPQPSLPPPLPMSQSQMLSRVGASTSPPSKRSSESPHSANSKNSVPAPSPSPVHQAIVQQSPPAAVRESPIAHMRSKIAEERIVTSPLPVKLPGPTLPGPASSKAKEPLQSPPLDQPGPIVRTPTASPNNKSSDCTPDIVKEQTPAQLAFLLSQALADADSLRRELVSERRRAARAERLLVALQDPSSPNSATTKADAGNNDGRLPESAAKAVLDAEARTEKAERARDDALHALASLSSSFAELERYEAACALRASDARGAYSRLLTSFTTAHPPPQSSPGLSTGSPRDELKLNLPRVPAPLPSLPPAQGPSISLPPPHASAHASRYARPLPAHATYIAAHSPTDTRQANAFESLPLPPPPSATGLGSLHAGLPMKRTHSHRGRAEEIEYEEQKRRRLMLEMDVDMVGPDVNSYAPRSASRHSNHYHSGPPSAQPLSAHPTTVHSFSAGPSPPTRNYDRSAVQFGYLPAPVPNHHRDNTYAPAPSGPRYPPYEDREREYFSRDRDPTNIGLVRMDARELAREAKARERRGRELESYARPLQAESQAPSEPRRSLHGSERVRRRSASRSSTRSKSSLSLDEMLLETATDGGRGRPSPPDQPGVGVGVRQGQGYGVAQLLNGGSSSHAPPTPLPAAQAVAKAPSTQGPTTNGTGRKPSVPASQLMTLGPSGTIVSGGGGDAATAASVDPAIRYPGLRTCRQCGQPGRYKEGKCVEKWGPGPQGPGTVCDRCRKKMKRVERRGTLDAGSAPLRTNHSHSQKASHATLPLTHTQSSYSQSFTQSQAQSQSQSSRARAPASRTDTLIIDPERRSSDQSHSPGRGSRYHASVPAASAAARHPSLAIQAHYSAHSQQSQHQHPHRETQRRAPTPPYITSISSREQHHDEDDLAEDDDDREASRSAAARYAHSESYARQPLGGDERDELVEEADGDADVDADGSGVGSADAEAEAEADADADIMDAVDATMKTED